MAEKEKKAPAKRAKNGAAQRGPDGRFLPGNNANPRGRPSLPPEFKDFAKEAPGRLREIADDPATPVKVKADIERWFAEMWYGKSPQALDIEGKMETTGVKTVRFEGELDKWSQ